MNSFEQRQDALAKANRRRGEAARFKDRLRRMPRAQAARVVAAALVRGDHIGQAGQVLLAIPLMGPVKVRALLGSVGVKPFAKAHELSEVARFRLSFRLRMLANDWEAYEVKRDSLRERKDVAA